MTSIDILKLSIDMALVVAVTPILGLYMKKVFSGEKTFLDPLLKPVERLIYDPGVTGANKVKAAP